MISFLVRTDGRREYLPQAISTAEVFLKANFDRKFIIDDSGDPEYAEWLDTSFPTYECIHHPERLGMEAGVRTAYATALLAGSDYVFATEDDFIFNRTVNVQKMARILHCEPHLTSLTLKRNPWSPEEINAGGQIELSPLEYTERSCPSGHWVQHRHLFSFNPSLIRSEALQIALTAPSMLEAGITEALQYEQWWFAYYGKRDDPPRCEHIGHARSSGYRW